MSEELRACPFCGSYAEDTGKGFWSGYARCINKCTGFILIEIWNTSVKEAN